MLQTFGANSSTVPLNEVVNTILFVLSDISPTVTGVIMPIDNGFTIK